MSFIQVQQSLVSHRKTLRLARLLGLDRYAVVGRLVALWAWCLENAVDGRLAKDGDDIDAEILADVMGWDGKPAELVDSLITAGFLDVDSSTQDKPVLSIHDWRDWLAQDDEAGLDGAADAGADDTANAADAADAADDAAVREDEV